MNSLNFSGGPLYEEDKDDLKIAIEILSACEEEDKYKDKNYFDSSCMSLRGVGAYLVYIHFIFCGFVKRKSEESR